MKEQKLYCHKCNVDIVDKTEEYGVEEFDNFIPDCAKCGTKLITEDEKQKIINIVNNYGKRRWKAIMEKEDA